jgi:hypothetical protein
MLLAAIVSLSCVERVAAQASSPPTRSRAPAARPTQPAPRPQAAQAATPPRQYRIIGVGDTMMGSDWPMPIMDDRMAPDGNPVAVLGEELAAVFRGGDVKFVNYEGTIHQSSAGAKQCGNPAVCFTFRSPPWHAAYLRRAGFTMASNANNHARDFGEGGRAQTWDALTAAGFTVSASDQDGRRIGIQTLDDGTRVALVAFGHNPGLNMVQNLPRVAELVRQAQAQADMVIVSCHIGAEGRANDRVTRETEIFLGENRGNPYAFAHAAVDAGADVVFCHGPHIPRAVEVYRGRFIAYSLGNFWTYGRFNLSDAAGYAPVADLHVARDGALTSARILSAMQSRPGGPTMDPSGAAARQIGMLTARDTADSGTSVAADGTVSWRR